MILIGKLIGKDFPTNCMKGLELPVTVSHLECDKSRARGNNDALD